MLYQELGCNYSYSILQVNEVRASGHGSASAPTINDNLYLTNWQSAVLQLFSGK
ncbi:hypothetical protein H6G33_27740 [Calothrix sp. FACHB-1219]|uniref:hypothetical protein n=1 Tax=unclassified Calothrix TaxID=2619626 RepID=UPI0016833AB8|nr:MULTISPECIES: hypothetical protein [unclassified Calothrix]MBD2206026.1 hypothetical protein [Calothrix sp. FACHB-168]MBD2220799.1 hypothetical protein [Calothrix sp. FACHB-1219]